MLRPGGRLAFSDVLADPDMDAATKADMAAWTGCIAGALTTDELTAALTGAGFTDVEIRPTHRVHTHAQAAIIRAVLPTTIQLTTVLSSTEETPVTTPAPTFVRTSVAVEVYDPAMCCSTGVCGPSVDPALARFESDLRWLGEQGATVTRRNLAQEPAAFVANPLVAAMLQSGGEEVLPIVLVDGKLRSSGTWLSRTDLAAAAGLPVSAGVELLAPQGESCGAPADSSAPGGCC